MFYLKVYFICIKFHFQFSINSFSKFNFIFKFISNNIKRFFDNKVVGREVQGHIVVKITVDMLNVED